MSASLEANQQALALDPDYAEGLYNAASDAYELGQLDDAVRYQMRYTDHAEGRGALASYLIELGFHEAGQALAEQVLEVEPLVSYLNVHLAEVALLDGQLEAARKRLARMRDAYPEWPRVWLRAGEVELRAGEVTVARQYLDRAIEKFSSPNRLATLRMAQVMWDQDRAAAKLLLEAVHTNAEAAIADGSEHWGPWWALAAVAALEERTTDATAAYAQAIDAGRLRPRWDRQETAFVNLHDHPAFEQLLRDAETRLETMRRGIASEVEAWVARAFGR